MSDAIFDFWMEKNANLKNIAKLLMAGGAGAASSAGATKVLKDQNPDLFNQIFEGDGEPSFSEPSSSEQILSALGDLKDSTAEAGENMIGGLQEAGGGIAEKLQEIVDQNKPEENNFLDNIQKQIYGGRTGSARLRDLTGENDKYRAGLRLQGGLKVPDKFFDR